MKKTALGPPVNNFKCTSSTINRRQLFRPVWASRQHGVSSELVRSHDKKLTANEGGLISPIVVKEVY